MTRATLSVAAFQSTTAYDPENGFALVRGGQLEATRLLPNVGLASAIDVGSVTEIHPYGDRTSGRRHAGRLKREGAASRPGLLRLGGESSGAQPLQQGRASRVAPYDEMILL